MPGIHFFTSNKPICNERWIQIEQTCRKLCYLPDYNYQIHFKGKNCCLITSSYPNYPINIFEYGKYFTILEGKIYDSGINDITRFLQELTKYVFNTENNRSGIDNYLSQTLSMLDGDYNICTINKDTEEFIILNDSYGKLLLYNAEKAGEFVVSREVKFIQNILDLNDIDNYAAAEMLMLKFVTGSKTLLKNVYRFPHASYVSNLSGDIHKIRMYHDWDLSENSFGKTVQDHTDNLIDIFIEAIKNRERTKTGYKSILGLSGGLDSRAVLGGLEMAHADYVATSSLNYAKSNKPDVKVAEQVASLYNTEFDRIELPQTQFEDYLKIIQIRDALNTSDMAVALDYYRYLLKNFPSGSNFYTGDGGAHIKTDYRKTNKIRTAEDFFKYTVKIVSYFSQQELSEIIDIDWGKFKMRFMESAQKYPGKTWAEKYYYFTVFDRRVTFLFEGEERTRAFFWTVTPFEAQPFLSLALRLSDSMKRKFALSHMFLSKLDPRLVDIQYADLNTRFNTKFALTKMAIKAVLHEHPALLKLARKTLLKKQFTDNYKPEFHREVCEIISKTDSLGKLFKLNPLYAFLDRNSNQMQYKSLLTIILYIHSLTCNKSK